MAVLAADQRTFSDYISFFIGKSRVVPAFRDLIMPTRDILSQVLSIVAAIRDYENGVTHSVQISYSIVLDTREAISNLIIQAGPILDVPFNFILLLRETNRQLAMISLAKEVFVSRELALDALDNVNSNSRLISTRTYKVEQGDTLLTIARKFPSEDEDTTISHIIALNNLDYPYVVSTAFDREFYTGRTVARPGDEITIPGFFETFSGNQVVPNDFDRLFGTDIKLEGSGYTSDNLVHGDNGTVPFDTSTNDVATVTGIANIVQSLQHRVLTERGSLPRHPTYGSGFPRYVGVAGTESAVRLATLEVGRAVLEDPRISSISDLKGTIDQRQATMLFVSFRATVINSDTPFGVNLIVPRTD